MIRADLILKALYDRHVQRQHPDIFLTQVKTGPTQTANRGQLFILDGLAIKPSWANPCLTGYEVKVSRSDFVGDQKWPAYLNYCHQFNFVCPSKLIQPEELPAEVGLIWCNQETRALSTRKKAVYRPIETPWNLLYYIIIARTDRERHPFFSSCRDLLEAYVADRAERRELGYQVGSKLAKDVRDLANELGELKRKLSAAEARGRQAGEYERALRELGIPICWGWEERLKERLNAGVGQDVRAGIERLAREAARLEKLVAKGASADA